MLSRTATDGDLTLLTWRSTGGGRSPESDAEEAYAALAADLAEREAVPLQERIFGELGAAEAICAARARVVGERTAWEVPPTFVEGAPVGTGGLAGVHVVAARPVKTRVVRDGDRVAGRVVDTPSARLVGLADVGRRVSGRRGAGPVEETGATIEAAAELLGREGLSFRDVARTWFYLKDILDWYGAFNAVRTSAFRRMGLVGANGDGSIPASTGIEGRNVRGGWCTLDLIAARARAGARFTMERLRSEEQNEAPEYGSAFARGIALTLGEWRYCFVSGTASIDDHGATVHTGDFEAQTDHTLRAVSAVLERAGAALPDVRQATAFLKNPCDRKALDRIGARTGLADLPVVTTVADVCREELLFEIDATAIVPSDTGQTREALEPA